MSFLVLIKANSINPAMGGGSIYCFPLSSSKSNKIALLASLSSTFIASLSLTPHILAAVFTLKALIGS